MDFCVEQHIAEALRWENMSSTIWTNAEIHYYGDG